MRKTATLYICGTILATLSVLGIIGHSMAHPHASKEPPIAILGISDGSPYAIAATCSQHDPNHLVIELILHDGIAEVGDTIRVLINGSMMPFEAREKGIIGTAIDKAIVPRIIDTTGSRLHVWVLDWDGADLWLDIHGKWSRQIPLLPCMTALPSAV